MVWSSARRTGSFCFGEVECIFAYKTAMLSEIIATDIYQIKEHFNMGFCKHRQNPKNSKTYYAYHWKYCLQRIHVCRCMPACKHASLRIIGSVPLTLLVARVLEPGDQVVEAATGSIHAHMRKVQA